MASARIERDQSRVERAEEDAAAVHGDSAIHGTAAMIGGAEIVDVLPATRAGGGVERDHVVERRRQIQRSVHDDRRRLERFGDSRVIGPCELQAVDVRGVDLRQR